MSESFLRERGRVRRIDGHVVACAFDRAGSAAFGTADGVVHLAAGADWAELRAHGGALHALVPFADGFATGGDDGTVMRIEANVATTLADFDGRWIEALAVGGDGADARLAVAHGRRVSLLDARGTVRRTIGLATTATAVGFDARGKRIAIAHYNGASLAFSGSDAPPRVLEWKGSHIGVAVHPAGDAVVTAMQENALHGWRLPDGHNMRMSGYPSKTQALSFSRNGRWLASSGAEAAVLWPFFGGGPMGKAPLELGGSNGALCTRVAFNPRADNLAAGHADGAVLLCDVATERVLPLLAPDATRGAISALAWSPDGAALAVASERGELAVLDLARR